MGRLAEHGRIIHHVDRTDEVRAEQFLQLMLKMADHEGIDSATFAMAIADALAVTAATLDQEVSKQQFADRLQAFCDRAAKKYVQVNAVMARRKWNPYS